MKSNHFLDQSVFDLAIRAFAARNTAHIRRIDSCLGRDPVVNPSIFRDQVGDVSYFSDTALAISVAGACRSHTGQEF